MYIIFHYIIIDLSNLFKYSLLATYIIIAENKFGWPELVHTYRNLRIGISKR